ncbi:MAG: RnfABCDGE type electron transport complex subunit G [Oscillospiraceae bacterium]|nr:RnfABCDGE type electron transport complex subunit G [Oscillospiraceae bacterium]
MKNAKYILRLTLTLLIITAVVAGLLALVDYLTAEKIAALKSEKAQNAMKEVLPADSYEELPTEKEGITAAYKAGDLGYVVRLSVNGFGGAIDMMVGVQKDGTVSGVSIISHAETASLGANCTREDWRSQFVGLSGNLAVDKDGGSIDSLTGATVTSRAVTKGINLALEFVEEVGK